MSPHSTERGLAIVIIHGKAQGGLQEFTVTKGSAVTITVSTSDTTSEVHLHGYDLKSNLSPGTPAVISFVASISGVFEIELEATSVKIADLTVR